MRRRWATALMVSQGLVIAALAALLWLRAGAQPPAVSAPAMAGSPAPGAQAGADGDGVARSPAVPGGSADGDGTVHLGEAVLQASAVKVAPLQAAAAPRQGEAWGEVLPTLGLADARLRLRQAEADAAQWDQPLARARRESARLEALWQDGGNVARKLVEQAQGEVDQVAQRQEAARAVQAAVRSAVRAEWGEALLLALEQPDGGAVAGVLDGRQRLLLVAAGDAAHATVSVLGAGGPLAVSRLGPATQVTAGGSRPTWYWLAPAGILRSGQRVSMPVGTATHTMGVRVPEAAVVWHAGQPWVYLEEGPGRFRRQAIEAPAALASDWFVAAPLRPGQRVVVQGAQLLLSEESKALIRNENGD
ncbi:MAG: hypothetical protein KGI67_04420 [Pseudomonadota bacterium]|nr:hypothetical protein [Pseudomonadota bacterium]